MNKLRLAIFSSHSGSNFQAIIDAIKEGRLNAEIACLITNNSNAYCIERAKANNIPYRHISNKTHPNQSDYEKALMNTLREFNVNLIVLAGYMKMIPPSIIKAYKNRIVNIHPALLPKFGGKGMFGINVHKAVIDAGEKITGATVHLVDEIYDNGKILNQMQVEVLPDDTPESLAQRVLAVEHQLYPQTLQLIAEHKIQLD
jgi:phosphoribosylglycinamide formyltransferase (EC 2.1.2.2)